MNLIRFVRPLRLAPLLLASALGAYACSSTEDEPALSVESAVATPADGMSDAILARSDRPYVVPYTISLRSADEQAAYVQSLSDQQFGELVENARILAFLRLHLADDRLEQLGTVMPQLDVLTPTNVEPYLSTEELTQLAAFEYDGDASSDPGADAISKGCSAWRRRGTTTQRCDYFVLHICVDCDHYVRDCSWWEVFASESEDRNCRVVPYHN